MRFNGVLRTEAVNEYFAPIRERRQRYENDLDYVKDVLHEGNRRANEIAEQTLAEVQDAMGGERPLKKTKPPQ